MRQLIIPGLLIIAMCGCAGSKPKKATKNATSGDIRSRYPSELYIVRSGRGDTQNEAADLARFEIVTFFESRISGESLLRQTAKSAITRGKLFEERLTELVNDITVSSDRTITGIDIVQNKKAKDGGYEAWAVLSRMDYASVLNGRIEALDSSVNERIGKQQATDLEQARSLAKTAAELVERERFRGDVTILIGSMANESRADLLTRVTSSLDSLIAHALDVAVVFDGDIDDKIKPGIVKGLTDSGIRLKMYPSLSAANRSGADLLIKTSVALTERTTKVNVGGRDQTLHWSDWVLSLNAIDPGSQEIIDTVVLSDRASGRDTAQARDRMANRINREQTPAVAAWIYDVIFKPAD